MWPFRRKPRLPPREPDPGPVQLPPQNPDDPVQFGFKNTWWALATTDTQAVVAAIRLQNAQPANWRTGVKYAYERSVFVTPPVDGWTLIVGFYFPPSGQGARDEVLGPLIRLSDRFGTACVFGTHRIVEYHVWAKAVAGSLVRGYGWVGESGRTFWDEGPTTAEEQKLGFAFFDERCPEAKDDCYWEREDLDFPDEMRVMEIARGWCVSPIDLHEYTPEEKSLGVLGSHSELLNRSTEKAN
jgi:hypothetical protein